MAAAAARVFCASGIATCKKSARLPGFATLPRAVFPAGKFRAAGDPQGGKSGCDRGNVEKLGRLEDVLCSALPDPQKTRPAAAAMEVFCEHPPAHFVPEPGHGGFSQTSRQASGRFGLF